MVLPTELPGQNIDRLPRYFDTGASGMMTPSRDKMTNFTPCKGNVEMGGGEVHEIKVRRDIGIDFLSGVESLCLSKM